MSIAADGAVNIKKKKSTDTLLYCRLFVRNRNPYSLATSISTRSELTMMMLLNAIQAASFEITYEYELELYIWKSLHFVCLIFSIFFHSL